jgi:hypothetical protein
MELRAAVKRPCMCWKDQRWQLDESVFLVGMDKYKDKPSSPLSLCSVLPAAIR